MGERMRLFFGLPVEAPPAAVRLIGRLERLGPAVKTVDPKALHLTLRFVGEVEPRRVDELVESLEGALAEVKPGPIEVSWGLPGFFPPGRRKQPRTVVLPPTGLGEDSALHRLEAALSARLASLAAPIEPEGRAYRPHLTLARLKQGRGKARLPLEEVEGELNRFAEADFGRARIDRVHLYQSELTPRGPRYTSRCERVL